MFSKAQTFALIMLALAASFVWYAVFTTSSGVLLVSVLNVGQGDAIFFETPSGTQVLIDGGPGRAVLSELGRVMPSYDRSIDMIISTHTDFDHLAGLVEVLKNYDVGMVIENGGSAATGVYTQWRKELEAKHIQPRVARAGDRVFFDHNIELDFYGPFDGDFAALLKKPNEAMVVSRLLYGKEKFLFMGDIERGDELRLASSNLDIKSNMLKVAHHGSKYASSDFFLSKVAPEYAVISVGAKNSYGHPDAGTIERLARTGAKVLRTDIDGRVMFTSDGRRIQRSY